MSSAFYTGHFIEQVLQIAGREIINYPLNCKWKTSHNKNISA